VLHVSNFTQDFTKDKLNEALETNEFIRRVKKMRDSSFVHFENSVNAMQAMEAVDGRMIYGANIQVLL
jgi:RNA recognition motif-containing protein